MAEIKSMTLEQAKSYLSQLKSQGKTESTSKEAGKVADYIKTLQPEKYGAETVQSAYEKLSSGVTERGGWTEANLAELNRRGIYPNLEPIAGQGAGDLDGYFSQFQDGAFASAGSPELRESIVAQLEPEGMESPEPINYVEQFEQYREKYGVQDLENTLTELKKQIRDEYAIREARTLDAEGKPVAMGVIAGRVSEIERQENRRIDTLNREAAYINDQLTTAYGAIEMYMNFEKMTFDDARQAYQDAFNKNLQIYKLVDEELDQRQATARANLQTIMNAVTAGNLSYGDMSSDQKAMISKLELQSGFPLGFTAGLQMSPKDQLLSVNDKTGEALLMDGNGNFIVKQTGMTPTPTTTGATAANLKNATNLIIEDLKSQTNWADGHTDPQFYRQKANEWSQAGFDLEDYYSATRNFVNPAHYQDYGIPSKYISGGGETNTTVIGG